MPSSLSRRPQMKRTSTAEGSTLDRLIRDGPPEADLERGLESMRLKILDQGVKSDNDGMVGLVMERSSARS